MRVLRSEDSAIEMQSRDSEVNYTDGNRHCYTQIRSSSYLSASYNHQMNTKSSTDNTDLRPQWTLQSGMIAIFSLVLLFTLLPSTEASACSLHRSVHTVRFRQCIPKRVLSFNCRGTCDSYSSLNPADLMSIIRNCNCCTETGFRTARIPLRCPKPDGESGYRNAHVRVKLPTGCSCRPCEPVPTIEPGEFL
ncbi:hypothetical protein EGW08_014831 [Elysia chlorotica]|uniref:CTCK domain-containing protein n=1 Tax=Elysia chlorotica TaxID=188477 RepID=A0A3S0ZL52_ELYCH|nr:hypothetical protein EGW08_014831 [Elysia chlorotica]